METVPVKMTDVVRILRSGFERLMDMTTPEFEEIFGVSKNEADHAVWAFLNGVEDGLVED